MCMAFYTHDTRVEYRNCSNAFKKQDESEPRRVAIAIVKSVINHAVRMESIACSYPGPSMANFAAIDGPPDQLWLPWMVRFAASGLPINII